MKEITLEELLEAGCHFGHQVIRSNPKARDFVFEARDNIQIIDLAKTKEGLQEALEFVKNLAAKQNSTFIIVGTKRQAQGIVAQEVKKAKEALGDSDGTLFSVATRWVGGMLTNFSEVSKNLKKLKDLEEKLKSKEEKAKYTKKEIGLWEKEKQRLEALYGGILEMKKSPDAMFIIDSHLENLAVKEAQRMNVDTVAIVDTNADPNIIDYPIPANDDAVGSIKLITSYIIDAWIEGRKKIKENKVEIKPSSAKASEGKSKEQEKEKAEVKKALKPVKKEDKKAKVAKTAPKAKEKTKTK